MQYDMTNLISVIVKLIPVSLVDLILVRLPAEPSIFSPTEDFSFNFDMCMKFMYCKFE